MPERINVLGNGIAEGWCVAVMKVRCCQCDVPKRRRAELVPVGWLPRHTMPSLILAASVKTRSVVLHTDPMEFKVAEQRSLMADGAARFAKKQERASFRVLVDSTTIACQIGVPGGLPGGKGDLFEMR